MTLITALPFGLIMLILCLCSDGRMGNDIQYLTRDEIIADVLREYERYLSIISDDSKSMMFTDKKRIVK